jgi:hypothetical protein
MAILVVEQFFEWARDIGDDYAVMDRRAIVGSGRAPKWTRAMPVALRQFVEQRLSLLQIERIEAFSEPAVDWREQIAGLIPLALIAPEPRHAYCGAQFIGFCLLPLRNAQRRFEGALALVKPVETEERDPFEAMEFRRPTTVAGFILHLEPVSRRGKRGPVLAPPRRRLGQAGKPVRTKVQRAAPAGKPRAQAGDRFLVRSLLAQRGTAQQLRFKYESEPLLGDERFGCLKPLQCQLRLTAFEAQHRIVKQVYLEGERVGDALG